MYVHGLNQSPAEPEENITWLDYLILSNPQGVMRVLAGYGYTGYLAPQGPDEMYEVCLDLMDKKGDEGVIALLKSSTLYDLMLDISKEETKITVPFKNATGEESVFITTIKTINYKKLIENALLIIGVFYLAGKLWDLVTKAE